MSYEVGGKQGYVPSGLFMVQPTSTKCKTW